MLTANQTSTNPPSDPHDPDWKLSRIHLEWREDQVAILNFDHPDQSANIFDEETLDELGKHLDWLESEPDLQGVILISAKPSIFIAGADIDALRSVSGDAMEHFISKGQEVFSRLANLRVPTVAAIHGACMGGGLEVALACDWRVATPDKVTSIGLPETQLGILPAWGGSTRLPRLIGLPKAVGLILAGSRMNGKKALKLGVVDSVVHREHLLAEAESLIARGKPKRQSHVWTNNPVSATILRWFLQRKVETQTRGNYPAQPAALGVVTRATWGPIARGLELERKAVIELAKTSVAKNLIRVFLLQQRSRKLKLETGASQATSLKVERTAVIGAGVMGAGIAQWTSSRGFPVVLQDVDETRVAAGMRTIRKTYEAAVKRRLFTKHEAERLQDQLFPAATPVPLHQVDLVIEAAVENLEVKKKIFADLCARTRDDTLLATNTSALPIGDLATAPGVTHPERILGLHFFNPVHRMKLVEIVVAEHTAPEAVESALAFVKSIGKMPVVVKDSPGFLVNRIFMPYLIAAGRLLDQGVDVRLIDEAMLDFGMPMGPIRLLDEIGLDVAIHVADTMEGAFGKRLAAPALLSKMVEVGYLGRKSGQGFYTYGDKPRTPQANAEVATLRSARDPFFLERETIATYLAGLTVKESLLCLEEGVASDADDIDFAMIMGTGWAPFRGGPLRYRDELGHDAFEECFENATNLIETP